LGYAADLGLAESGDGSSALHAARPLLAAVIAVASGECLARRDEQIGRGHSERLVPMIAELLDGRVPSTIVVGVGPGSFTGIRVGIAAAHGLAIGWGAKLLGLSSLALLAAGAGAGGLVAAAVIGGHGELFVQEFDARLDPAGALVNASAAVSAAAVSAPLVVGSGAQQLVGARGWGTARDAFPSAADFFALPASLRSLDPRPVYARAPDARAMVA